MKKFRGQRRYYKNLKKNEKFESLDFDSWFNLWHTHSDWNGNGNISWKHRKSHLESLFRTFENLKTCLKKRSEEFQLWGLINIDDSSEDGIYIHTKNPNEENFPFVIEENENSFALPSHLKVLLDSSKYSWYINTWHRHGTLVRNIIVYDSDVGLTLK